MCDILAVTQNASDYYNYMGQLLCMHEFLAIQLELLVSFSASNWFMHSSDWLRIYVITANRNIKLMHSLIKISHK